MSSHQDRALSWSDVGSAAGAARATDLSEEPPAAGPAAALGVLLLCALDTDLISLLDILGTSGRNIYWYTTRVDAAAGVNSALVPVVLCDRNLPDGDWKDVLRRLSRLPNPPCLIVADRLADDSLWAEVLNLGGYDVLLKPFDHTEVLRTVDLAWRAWMRDTPAHPTGINAA